MRMRCWAIIVAIGLFVVPSTVLAKDKTKSASPKGNMGSWFPEDVYPPEAKRNHEQGRVVVQLAVDKYGNPTGCTVVGSSGSAALDARTCELALANARFNPATDKNGQPVETSYTLPGVRWELKDAPPIRLEGPWRLTATMQVDKVGKISSCNEQRSGPVPTGMHPCSQMEGAPPAYGMFLRGTSAAAFSEVMWENSMDFDDAPAPTMSYEAKGRETLMMAVIHFSVGTDGTVRDCQIEKQSGPGSNRFCDSPRGPYLPIEEPRGVVVKYAISRPAAQ